MNNGGGSTSSRISLGIFRQSINGNNETSHVQAPDDRGVGDGEISIVQDR